MYFFEVKTGKRQNNTLSPMQFGIKTGDTECGRFRSVELVENRTRQAYVGDIVILGESQVLSS